MCEIFRTVFDNAMQIPGYLVAHLNLMSKGQMKTHVARSNDDEDDTHVYKSGLKEVGRALGKFN